MSLPEALLWRERRRRSLGRHIRRQHPIGPYVLDFYCDSGRLAIEVDGQAHRLAGTPEHDARRNAWLAARGIRTLRLPAVDVLKNLHQTVETIIAALDPPP
jgi:very-short-patch-repair endonuclease